MNPKAYNAGNEDFKAGFREGRDQVVTRILELALAYPMDDAGKKMRQLANQICEEFPADYSTPPAKAGPGWAFDGKKISFSDC
jgi:hypothetical protein